MSLHKNPPLIYIEWCDAIESQAGWQEVEVNIFDSAIDAVKCGIELQLGLQKDPAIPIRIGIHAGDIIFSEEEIIGDGVNNFGIYGL